MKSIGRDFMRLTRYSEISQTPQNQGIPQPPLELPYPADAPLVVLPDPNRVEIPALDLRDAIAGRETCRRYREQNLTLDELSFLLWATQGVKSVTPRPVTLRTVPSAGARHAFETYLLVNQVDGLEAGLYRYAAIKHALIPVELSAGVNERITHACLDQKQVQTSAVTFMWVAVVDRMAWRYVERGYRYLFLDAGHICQNLYLAAEPLNCGVCAIAAYDDDLVNSALSLDGESQFVAYIGSLGKKVI
jgi:SagB-type dehydrogenase family enzyme